MNWEKILSYVTTSGLLILLLNGLIKFIKEFFKIKKIKKHIAWEIFKNHTILTEIKKKCDNKLKHPKTIFNSYSFVYDFIKGILSSGLIMKLPFEYVTFISELKIGLQNIEYSEDQYINITKEMGVNEILNPSEFTNGLLANITRDIEGVERKFYKSKFYNKIQKKYKKKFENQLKNVEKMSISKGKNPLELNPVRCLNEDGLTGSVVIHYKNRPKIDHLDHVKIKCIETGRSIFCRIHGPGKSSKRRYFQAFGKDTVLKSIFLNAFYMKKLEIKDIGKPHHFIIKKVKFIGIIKNGLSHPHIGVKIGTLLGTIGIMIGIIFFIITLLLKF